MPQTSLSNVNWLSVRELSEMWAPELGIPSSTIERELRIALYKLEHDYPWHEPIDFNPETVDLPSPDVLIDRDFIESFHDKEVWKLPEFWFKDLPTGPSYPGRPSYMNAIVQELKARANREELAESLAEQSRQLSEWAEATFPGTQTPKPKSVENGIRTAYKSIKKTVTPEAG